MRHATRKAQWDHRIALILILMVLPVAWTGCAALDGVIQKPTAQFQSVQFKDVSLLQSTAVFNFDVNNPNPVGIPAGRMTYDLSLNGRRFIDGALDQGFSLPANGKRQLSIPVTMPYLDFFNSLSQLWQTRQADYVFNGSLAIGPMVIPFRAQGRLKLPQMPTIALEAVKIQNLSLTGALLNCRLKLENPNAFNLLFKRLNYDIKLGGQSFSKSSARPRGPIVKNGLSTIDLSFDVSFARLGRAAYRLLSGREADYTLDGGLVFDSPQAGEQQVPFSISGKVPLRR